MWTINHNSMTVENSNVNCSRSKSDKFSENRKKMFVNAKHLQLHKSATTYPQYLISVYLIVVDQCSSLGWWIWSLLMHLRISRQMESRKLCDSMTAWERNVTRSSHLSQDLKPISLITRSQLPLGVEIMVQSCSWFYSLSG